MTKSRISLQVIVFAVFLSFAPVWSAPLSPQEEKQMLVSNWKLPSQFTLNRMEQLLNQFSQKTCEKAFRFIGIEQDFFHGHVLFERKLVDGKELLHPRAILYHTQEDAHKAHWDKSVDPKYDYLNVTTRNWIQWLSDDMNEDGIRIENARDYLDFSQKDPKQFFDETTPPQKELHYTIHAKNLDPQKLGFKLDGELQFEFYLAQDFPSLDNRQINVTFCANSISLSLFTNTLYLERRSKNL